MNTTDAITIRFNEQMDVPQMYRYVSIQSDTGYVKGQSEVLDQGKALLFTPKNKWRNKEYQLRINIKLEDMAANNFARKFDQPPAEKKLYDSQVKYVSKSLAPN